MRVLVLSDIHANAEALQAVLSHIRRKRIDVVACLGDFVGYGAAPNVVVDMMRTLRLRKVYVRGNHDRVAAGIGEVHDFTEAARAAVLWTREHLSAPNRRFLTALAAGPTLESQMLLCHGSPDDEDEYIFSEAIVKRLFEGHHAPFMFYGHTHIPAVYSIDEQGIIRTHAIDRMIRSIKLDPARRYLINPGSVGQPRDRNPNASFAVIDLDRRLLRFYRVAYDVAKAQRSIIRAGLPRMLADRLAFGT